MFGSWLTDPDPTRPCKQDLVVGECGKCSIAIAEIPDSDKDLQSVRIGLEVGLCLKSDRND